MKRFQFPLERVRRWRAGQAALEELKLEQLREQQARLEEEKRSIQRERAHSERDVLGRQVMEATELQNLDAFRVHARDKIREFENRERQAAAQIEQQVERVMEARRNAELLERLKQEAGAAWQRANDREQESLATELYLAQWTRRR